jgi:hypothetical protein
MGRIMSYIERVGSIDPGAVLAPHVSSENYERMHTLDDVISENPLLLNVCLSALHIKITSEM